MPKYALHVAKPAVKQIKNLDKKTRRAVFKALEQLERNPYPSKSEKLGGYPPFRRTRASDYRVIYAVEEDVIIVLRVRHRNDAYQGLDTLSPQLATALIELAENTIQALPTAGSA